MVVIQDKCSNSNLVGCVGRDSGWCIRYPHHQHHMRAFGMMVIEALLQKYSMHVCVS